MQSVCSCVCACITYCSPGVQCIARPCKLPRPIGRGGGGGGGGGGFKGVCLNPAEDFIHHLATHLVPYLFVRSPLSLAAIENLCYPNGETSSFVHLH